MNALQNNYLAYFVSNNVFGLICLKINYVKTSIGSLFFRVIKCSKNIFINE